MSSSPCGVSSSRPSRRAGIATTATTATASPTQMSMPMMRGTMLQGCPARTGMLKSTRRAPATPPLRRRGTAAYRLTCAVAAAQAGTRFRRSARHVADPLGDHRGDTVAAHRHAVERVGDLHGALLVGDDDELAGVAQLLEER